MPPSSIARESLRALSARLLGLPQPSLPGDDKVLTRKQRDLFKYWGQHPWNFLSGLDLNKAQTPIIRTKDEKDKNTPVKPFPSHLPYIKNWIDILGDPEETMILADKSRQMYLTTATLLYMVWECIFLPGRRWLLSKSTEDEAKELIKDKIRFPVSLMPPWFREYVRISDKPEVRVDFGLTGSYILGCAQNVADREARGGTASGVLIDEAAFQEMTGSIITACLPMAAKIVLITTPSMKTGGEVFKKYMDDKVVMDHAPGFGKGVIGEILAKEQLKAKPKKIYPQIPGMSIRKTRADAVVVHLDYWADPAKDAAWAWRVRSKMPTESAWRREYERDWDAADEGAFYKAFQNNPKKYLRPMRQLIRAPIFRGWDFGHRSPACVWLQIDLQSHLAKWRSWAFREIMCPGMDIYCFRDLVRYLSGEIPYEALGQHPDAINWLLALETDESVPPIVRAHPWVRNHPADPWKFVDWAGHEANIAVNAEVSKSLDRTRAQILAAGGVYLNVHYTTTKAKVDVIRRLLMPMRDGHPGLLVDPYGCPILKKGLEGGITFAKSTLGQPDPDEPRKDNKYSHLHEALGYVLANTVPLEDDDEHNAPAPPPVLLGHDGLRQPVYEDLGNYALDAYEPEV